MACQKSATRALVCAAKKASLALATKQVHLNVQIILVNSIKEDDQAQDSEPSDRVKSNEHKRALEEAQHKATAAEKENQLVLDEFECES
jgi:hypothetical protein